MIDLASVSAPGLVLVKSSSSRAASYAPAIAAVSSVPKATSRRNRARGMSHQGNGPARGATHRGAQLGLQAGSGRPSRSRHYGSEVCACRLDARHWNPDLQKEPRQSGLRRSPLRFAGESQKRQIRKSTLRLAVGFYVVLDFAQRAPPSGAGLAGHRGVSPNGACRPDARARPRTQERAPSIGGKPNA